MLDPAHLQALAAILRTGSFDTAAAALHVTPSAVSQRIRALEERVGTAVVVRAEPCRPTAAGARLARHAEEVALLERTLAADLGQTEGRVHVRIAVNADSLATWFLPPLAAVEGLFYDIVIDDQDHSAELLRRGEVQAAVTAHGAPLAGCNAFALGNLTFVAAASPAFVDRWFSSGVTAATLAEAPALTYNRKDRLQTDWARMIARRPIALSTHLIGSSHAFVEAAVLGLGWGMIPEALVRDEIAAAKLVPLADRRIDVAHYWQVARIAAEPLAPLTAAIRRAAAGTLR